MIFFYAEKREEKSCFTGIDQSIPIMEQFLPNRWSISMKYILRICFKTIWMILYYKSCCWQKTTGPWWVCGPRTFLCLHLTSDNHICIKMSLHLSKLSDFNRSLVAPIKRESVRWFWRPAPEECNRILLCFFYIMI